MVLKVLFVLAALALANLPPCSATDHQLCVSQAEFDSQMAAQTAAVENVVTQITALENGYRNWRNATLFILQWVVSRNPGKEIYMYDACMMLYSTKFSR